MTPFSSRSIAHLAIFLALFFDHASSSALANQNSVIQADSLSLLDGLVGNIPPDRTGIKVENFHMGAGSRIKISEETPLFFIRAENAVIGDGTRIVFNGKDGRPPGGHGMHAPTFILIIENVDRQGELTIEGIGGSGSDGERGERGSPGREAKCAGDGAGNGGRGGAGMPGGDAGNGGNLFLILPDDAEDLGVSVNLQPGEPGVGGLGGLGGAGGRGKSKCGVWPYWKRGSGNAGPNGPNGRNGSRGREGLMKVYKVSDFQNETIAEKVEDIISMLPEKGYKDVIDKLKEIASRI